MTAIILSVVATVGMLSAFLLLWVQSRRVEHRVQKLSESVARLERAGASLTAAMPGRVDVGPDLSHDVLRALEGLREEVARVASASLELQPALIAVGATESDGEIARGVVAQKLSIQGYQAVRLSEDDAEPAAGEPTKIHVEASRKGVAYKGYALVRGNEIVDSRLVPTYEMFP